MAPSCGFLPNELNQQQQTNTPLQCAKHSHRLLQAVTGKMVKQQGGPPTVIAIRIRRRIAIEVREVIIATVSTVGGVTAFAWAYSL